MSLTKDDLKQIQIIVKGETAGLEDKLTSKIEESPAILEKKLASKRDGFNLEDKLTAKIEASENKVISAITKEIADLADINRAVITRVDELDYRLKIVERKLGLVAHR